MRGNGGSDSSDSEAPECPLCLEVLDLTDRNFYPCPCTYQICLWCWHKLSDNKQGRCPACRTVYDPNVANAAALDRSMIEKAMVEKKKKSSEQREAKKTLRPDAPGMESYRNVRVLQKNLLYVVGLPAAACRDGPSGKKEFFGKFGPIVKIAITPKKLNNSSYCAYVTYKRAKDAEAAMKALNKISVDGRLVRAAYGTTKYCSYFLRGRTCMKPGCLYLHELAKLEDCYTKDDLTEMDRLHALQQSTPAFPQPVLSRSISAPMPSSSPPNEVKRVLPLTGPLLPLPSEFQQRLEKSPSSNDLHGRRSIAPILGHPHPSPPQSSISNSTGLPPSLSSGSAWGSYSQNSGSIDTNSSMAIADVSEPGSEQNSPSLEPSPPPSSSKIPLSLDSNNLTQHSSSSSQSHSLVSASLLSIQGLDSSNSFSQHGLSISPHPPSYPSFNDEGGSLNSESSTGKTIYRRPANFIAPPPKAIGSEVQNREHNPPVGTANTSNSFSQAQPTSRPLPAPPGFESSTGPLGMAGSGASSETVRVVPPGFETAISGPGAYHNGHREARSSSDDVLLNERRGFSQLPPHQPVYIESDEASDPLVHSRFDFSTFFADLSSTNNRPSFFAGISSFEGGPAATEPAQGPRTRASRYAFVENDRTGNPGAASSIQANEISMQASLRAILPNVNISFGKAPGHGPGTHVGSFNQGYFPGAHQYAQSSYSYYYTPSTHPVYGNFPNTVSQAVPSGPNMNYSSQNLINQLPPSQLAPPYPVQRPGPAHNTQFSGGPSQPSQMQGPPSIYSR